MQPKNLADVLTFEAARSINTAAFATAGISYHIFSLLATAYFAPITHEIMVE